MTSGPTRTICVPSTISVVLKEGVRGKYLDRYRAGTNLRVLAPDVRAAFPTDESVNQAMRSIMHGQTPA